MAGVRGVRLVAPGRGLRPHDGRGHGAGRPVVATAYSGNLDFMDDTTALLVPHGWRRCPRAPGPTRPRRCGPSPTSSALPRTSGGWPSTPAEAAELGTRAAARVRETGSISRTADFITDRVDAALAALAAPPLERDPDQNRAERAIKRARRAVREPATGRRLGWLGGFDRRQRERFHQVLQALGLVRRRADRALKVAQENRRELRPRDGAGRRPGGRGHHRPPAERPRRRAGRRRGQARERVDAEARAAGRQRQPRATAWAADSGTVERLRSADADEVSVSPTWCAGRSPRCWSSYTRYAPLLAATAPRHQRRRCSVAASCCGCWPSTAPRRGASTSTPTRLTGPRPTAADARRRRRRCCRRAGPRAGERWSPPGSSSTSPATCAPLRRDAPGPAARRRVRRRGGQPARAGHDGVVLGEHGSCDPPAPTLLLLARECGYRSPGSARRRQRRRGARPADVPRPTRWSPPPDAPPGRRGGETSPGR